jgi:hypothetical protein
MSVMRFYSNGGPCYVLSSRMEDQLKARFTLIAVMFCILISPSLAGQQSFSSEGGLITFSAPSGNIGCTFVPEGGTPVYVPADGGPELQCDRVEPVYLRFFLHRSGAAEQFDNVGDASCCSQDNILEYGNTWQFGPFTCISERTGLTCTRGDGHGFFISRKNTSVF